MDIMLWMKEKVTNSVFFSGVNMRKDHLLHLSPKYERECFRIYIFVNLKDITPMMKPNFHESR